jgi:hypothetical protein
MSRGIVGKITIYYGSGDEAEERGARLDAAAQRRGYLSKKGKPELSPLFVYSFEFVDALDPQIEAEADKLGLKPWDYVNRLFAEAKKKR